MKQLDTKRTGHINETQFATNILRNYPEEHIKSLLDIEIIPSELLNDSNMQPSVAGSRLNMRNDTNVCLFLHSHARKKKIPLKY